MPNGIGAGIGLGSSISAAGKSSKGASGKSTKGAVAKRGGGPARGARPAAAGVGRPGLTNISQLLAGTGAPGGVPGIGGTPGAGVPAGMPGMFRGGIPSGEASVSIGGLPTMPGVPSQYDFGIQNMGDTATLDFGSERGDPTSYISGRGGSQIGSVGEQDVTGFLDNLTMSKLENLSPEEKTAFDERMVEATKRKKSLKWPEGIDPELMEQRITAAESEKWPNSADFYKELRSLQTEPTTFQNVGSMLKTGAKGVGGYLQNLGQHMGVYQKPLWPAEGYKQTRGWTRENIIRGKGTPADWKKTSDFISKKRAENYAAGITVPPEKEFIASYMRGSEGRVNRTPYGINFVNAPDLSLPPKPSTYEARERTLAPQPQLQQQYFPRQQMPQGRMMSPRGVAGIGKDKEKKETFNLLEMLMGLLGLPFKVLGLSDGKSIGKSPQKNLNREPRPGEIDTRPAQFGTEPTIRV
jgi:hypothetical protein